MANIVRTREQQPQPNQAIVPRTFFDPLRLMRDLLRFDPFAEMTPSALEGPAAIFSPSFEVRETDNAYVFNADLPGVKEDDIDITLSGNRLTVSGHRESETRDERDRYYAYERSYGSFSRSFTLPDDADVDNAKAEMRDGVLKIELPKKAEAQPRRVALGKGGQPQQAQQQQQQASGERKEKEKPKA
jgi:HSP20 family protein